MYEQIIQYRSDSPVYASGGDLPPAPHGKVGQICDMHLHKEYEFLYIPSGRLKCITTDGEYILEGGDVLFVNSYVPHSTYSETDDTFTTMIQFNSPIVADSSLHYITRFLKFCDTPAYVFKSGKPETQEILNCMNTIVNEHKNHSSFWHDYVNANIFMLIAILRRYGILSNFSTGKKNEIKKIIPAIEYMNNNYSHQITTAELSSILRFNESYFCRLFKNTIGTTATEYLNFVRLCKAETMLKNGASISDASYRAGFSSLSYFNRIFKKYKHYTPSEFRKIIKHQEFDYSSENAI